MVNHQHKFFKLEEIGAITIVTFMNGYISKEQDIVTVGETLFSLIQEDGKKKIILDFINVDWLDQLMIGKLISVEKRAKLFHAEIVMCNASESVEEKLGTMRLDKFFTIAHDTPSAIALLL